MQGLMMDFPLTLTSFFRRAETLFQHKSIITRLPDKSIHRYTYKDFIGRAKKLAVALSKLGVVQGDRVGTLSWNHYQHLEIYFAAPCSGFVLHALNLRLSPDDLTYIINHAEDKVIIVDQVLLPLFEKFRQNINVSHVVVIPNGQGPFRLNSSITKPCFKVVTRLCLTRSKATKIPLLHFVTHQELLAGQKEYCIHTDQLYFIR